MTAELPVIAISAGDPAGIGAEVLVKSLASGALAQLCRPRVFGALGVRSRCAPLASPFRRAFDDVDIQRPPDFRFGAVSAACGTVAVRGGRGGCGEYSEWDFGAMVTCPINKEAVHAAGFVDDIGHQEILSRLTGAKWTATLLMTPGLKVVHLSTHKSLIEAARFVKAATIVEKLEITCTTLGGWGLRDPRIAVAALNPHGGEGGLLGR
jgi:4-hydroxythreonine-4-phosphate dehydrogenase